MVLLPENEYSRLKQYEPKVKSLEVDKNNVSTDQKLYAQKMIEERIMREANEEKPVSKPLPVTSTSPSLLPFGYIKKSIEKFPLQRRARALALFSQLRYASALTWDSKGQMIDPDTNDGMPILGSNILDLIHYATNTPNQLHRLQPPIGWDTFRQNVPLLMTNNDNQTLSPIVRTRRRQEQLQDSAETTTHFPEDWIGLN